MPSRNTLTQPFPNCSATTLSDTLDRNLRLLEGVSVTSKNLGSVSNNVFASSASRTLFVEAERNTWSRSARRSYRRNDSSTTLENTRPSSYSRQPVLTCSVQVIDMPNQATGSEGQSLAVQWLYGTDRTLFESFVSHVWRKVGADLREKK